VPSAAYDRKALWYDALLGRRFYHRVFWGSSPQSYTAFAHEALAAAGDGPFVEVGGGSLLFTANLYTTGTTPVTIVDRSAMMLRRARRRLGRLPVSRPCATLVGDAASLPIRSAALLSVLSLNLLHVPCDRAAIVGEIGRILVPGRGRLFVSALVQSGRWSDAYMSVLHRTGELGAPLCLEDLRGVVVGRWGTLESERIEGNMAFVVVRHRG